LKTWGPTGIHTQTLKYKERERESYQDTKKEKETNQDTKREIGRERRIKMQRQRERDISRYKKIPKRDIETNINTKLQGEREIKMRERGTHVVRSLLIDQWVYSPEMTFN